MKHGGSFPLCSEDSSETLRGIFIALNRLCVESEVILAASELLEESFSVSDVRGADLLCFTLNIFGPLEVLSHCVLNQTQDKVPSYWLQPSLRATQTPG